MENAKQEAIKNAYGKYWEQIKEYIDGFGWFNRTNLKYKECLFLFNGNRHLYETNLRGFFRPKSLQGIENNNGWVKIESEEDLPNETAYYHVINKKKKYFRKKFLCHIKDYKNKWKQITHYQSIEKPKPPIY